MAGSKSIARRAGRILAQILVGLVIIAAIVEGTVRYMKPSPPFQVVRGTQVNLENVDGVPVWYRPEDDAWRLACLRERPDALRIAVFGSSIFRGVRLETSEIFTVELQRQLDERLGRPTCVLNFAEAGYSLGQKMVMAKRMITELHPRWVIWEVWGNDWHAYRFLGDVAYSLRDAVVDDAGYPVSFSLPSPLHHWLFEHSRAYEHWTLTTVPRKSDSLDTSTAFAQHVRPEMDRLQATCEEQGCSLLVLPAPQLDQPFREQLSRSDYTDVVQWAEDRGVSHRMIAALLLDQDLEAIRLDHCCHYNAAGHALLGERIADVLVPEMKN